MPNVSLSETDRVNADVRDARPAHYDTFIDVFKLHLFLAASARTNANAAPVPAVRVSPVANILWPSRR